MALECGIARGSSRVVGRSRIRCLLGAADSAARYGSGHLPVHARHDIDGAAVRCRSAIRNSAIRILVAEHVNVNGGGKPAMSVSTTGMLAYWRGVPLALSRLTWVDRAGKTESSGRETSAGSRISA